MRIVEQWREIRNSLPEDWKSARLTLTVADDDRADRTALLTASLAPGRAGSSFRFEVPRSSDPEHVLERLDRDGVRGKLDLVADEERPRQILPAEAAPVAAEREPALAEQWDELVGRLPPDWSDLYAEIELDSSDFLERGALLLAPVNPAHYGGPLRFRFRVASSRGYGAYQGMARRAMERLDKERITGRLRPLRALSRTSLVSTQGPVWRIGGRPV